MGSSAAVTNPLYQAPPRSEVQPDPALLGDRRGATTASTSRSSTLGADGTAHLGRPRSGHARGLTADATTAPAPRAETLPVAARTTDAVKVYGKGDAMVRALDGISVAFAKGHFSAIMGPSGSGKSTLLHCLAGLDRLTSGTVHIGESELGSLNDRQLTMLRRSRVGFIFQSFNLVPTLSALDNIVLPLTIAGRKADPEALAEVIRITGLGDRLKHRPNRAVRRAAAACRGGASARQPARDHLRRRADRQPRLPCEQRPPRLPPARGVGARTDDHHGHARPASPRRTRTAWCSSPTAASSARCTTRPLTACSMSCAISVTDRSRGAGRWSE